MKNNKFLFTLSIGLLTSIILAGCGAQATPEPAASQAHQSTDPELAPATESAIETEAPTEVVPTNIPTEVSTENPAATATVSFANDVMPIIQSRCVNCHGGDRIEEGLLMRSYDEIMTGSDNGPVIVPGDTANSLLVELVTTKEMPKKGPKLTPPQIQIITDWVAAGALNN